MFTITLSWPGNTKVNEDIGLRLGYLDNPKRKAKYEKGKKKINEYVRKHNLDLNERLCRENWWFVHCFFKKGWYNPKVFKGKLW